MKASKSEPKHPEATHGSPVHTHEPDARFGGTARTSPLQTVADTSPRVHGHGGISFAQLASEGPRATLQRQRMERVFGSQNLKADATTVQRVGAGTAHASGSGGLPANLKSGIETMSGVSMDSVRVHYNSSKPANLGALAYAQGNDIHLARGQERHLPHEAWHVVQQAQGRVRATQQLKAGIPLNDDPSLEREADVMGRKAASTPV